MCFEVGFVIFLRERCQKDSRKDPFVGTPVGKTVDMKGFDMTVVGK